MENKLLDTEKEIEAILEKFSDSLKEWPEKNLEVFVKDKVVVVEEFFGLFEKPILDKIKDAEYIIFESYISEQNSGYSEIKKSMLEEFGEMHNKPFLVARELLLLSFQTFMQQIAFYFDCDLSGVTIANIEHLKYDYEALLKSNKKYLQLFSERTDDELKACIEELRVYKIDFKVVLEKFVNLSVSTGLRALKFLMILGKFAEKNNISIRPLGAEINKRYFIELANYFFNGKGNPNKYGDVKEFLAGIDHYFNDIECAALLQNSPQICFISGEVHKNDYSYLNPDEYFIPIAGIKPLKRRRIRNVKN